MKIERINDNQIRCTLNKSDLASRHLKISELAYGSEKARELFRDMMKQANSEFGFESEDLPLMIEAIPVSSECIVLIITKVENPEELDTRFSRFSDADEEDNDFNDDDDFDDFDDEDNDDGVVTLSEELDSVENLDSEMGEINSDLMNIFSQVKDYLNKKNISTKDSNNFVPFSKSISKTNKESNTTSENKDNVIKDKNATADNLTPPVIVRVFSFDSLDDVTSASKIILPIYSDDSILYKSLNEAKYYLTITRKNTSSVNFNKICNIHSEYGKKETIDSAGINYLNGHADTLIKKHAVQVLVSL
jgi:adapter protein MecA 1/2